MRTDASHAVLLMSTYQGEAYLKEQLDSILAQTHRTWTLFIRDDGSTDHTVRIIEAYQKRYDRIQLIRDNLGNIGITQSFARLMQHALCLQEKNTYFFFADQDDFWLPNKLSQQLQILQKEEDSHGDTHPILVFSDLAVVNTELKPIHPSFFQFEKLTPNTITPVHTLLAHNFVVGCTIAMNRHLLQQALPIPTEAIMHDWWCALYAAAEGKLIAINEPTVLYRQHSKNNVGSFGFYRKLKALRHLKEYLTYQKSNLLTRFHQAEQLAKRLNEKNIYSKLVYEYSLLPLYKPRQRLELVFNQLSIKPQTLARKCWFLLMLSLI